MSKELVSRETFLSSFKRSYTEVETSLGTFRIQNLSEPEKADHECSSMDKNGEFDPRRHKSHRRRLVLRCLVDAEGKRLLKDEDLAAMAQADPGVISHLHEAIREHCGFTRVEDTEKNSGGTGDDGSPTG